MKSHLKVTMSLDEAAEFIKQTLLKMPSPTIVDEIEVNFLGIHTREALEKTLDLAARYVCGLPAHIAHLWGIEDRDKRISLFPRIKCIKDLSQITGRTLSEAMNAVDLYIQKKLCNFCLTKYIASLIYTIV